MLLRNQYFGAIATAHIRGSVIKYHYNCHFKMCPLQWKSWRIFLQMIVLAILRCIFSYANDSNIFYKKLQSFVEPREIFPVKKIEKKVYGRFQNYVITNRKKNI